jgi:hypothetical protein
MSPRIVYLYIYPFYDTSFPITEERKVYRVLKWNPEGKKPLERPRRRWEDGIRMNLREIGWGVWIGFSWLGTGTSGGMLWMRWRTFGFWRHGFSSFPITFHFPFSDSWIFICSITIFMWAHIDHTPQRQHEAGGIWRHNGWSIWTSRLWHHLLITSSGKVTELQSGSKCESSLLGSPWWWRQ